MPIGNEGVKLPPETLLALSEKIDTLGPHAETQEWNSIIDSTHKSVFEFKSEEIPEKIPGFFFQNPESGQRGTEQNHVVHIADIPQEARRVLHVVIEIAEVEVREVLAGEVADGQALSGGGAIRVNDALKERKDFLSLEAAPQQTLERGMVDRVVVPSDVKLKKEGTRPREMESPQDGRMSSLVLAAGVAVVDLERFETGLQTLHDGMMDDPFFKRGGADPALLGVLYGEVPIVPQSEAGLTKAMG
jgi:hypothetical protein